MINWYLKKSKINTNKREAKKIADRLRESGRYKTVRTLKRSLSGNKATKTKTSSGWWIKVEKK